MYSKSKESWSVEIRRSSPRIDKRYSRLEPNPAGSANSRTAGIWTGFGWPPLPAGRPPDRPCADSGVSKKLAHSCRSVLGTLYCLLPHVRGGLEDDAGQRRHAYSRRSGRMHGIVLVSTPLVLLNPALLAGRHVIISRQCSVLLREYSLHTYINLSDWDW